MSRFGTRRNFFERINMALTGLVFTRALPFQEAAATRQPLTGAVDYYDKLGVTKTINAAGTYTYLTGSTMPPSVQAAVALAAKHPVYLKTCKRQLANISLDNCAAKPQWSQRVRLPQ